MSSSSQSKSVSGKILILGLAVAAFCLIYTGAWFWGTGKARAWLTSELANRRFNGISITCNDADVKGFPFRFGLSCGSISAQGAIPGSQASFGALRSAAQVYAPGHSVFELDGPAVIRTGHGVLATINWSLLHGSIVASLDGIDRTSIETSQTKAELSSSFTNDSAELTFEHGELHLRRNNGDLDVATYSTGTHLTSTMPFSQLPPFGFTAELTIADYASFLAGQRPAPDTTIKGQIHQFLFDFGDQGKLKLSGPFSRSPDGLISGEFDLEADNFTVLADTLKQAFPDARQTIDLSRQLLKGMTSDGKTARVHIAVKNGAMYLGGFIPLGTIPPV